MTNAMDSTCDTNEVLFSEVDMEFLSMIGVLLLLT